MHVGIGVGVVLIVIGLVLVFAIQADLPLVTDDVLGIILILGGILAIVLALIMNAQRARTKHVQENRYQGPPPV
jgi:uncharacterized membrane protein YidH (DUF202 family)